MTTLSTDARLVADYLSGDASALAAIYDRYAPGLYDTAAAMLSDRHDAADMVQDVFCIAAERLSQLREPDRLKPWLYSVLRHEVYRRTKKRKRATPVDFQDERTPDVASGYDPHAAGEAVAYGELAALVRAAASGLDERDRLVLELSVRQGLSGSDLADALGVTPDQSYSLVHRMRERVEKSLGALTVAQAGRRDCAQLDVILADWNGELTVLLRKRVNRHIEECDTCDRNRKKFAPLALFGAAPAFALPLGLRERVLAAAGSAGAPSVRFDTHRGFPRAGRLGRHAVSWVAAAAVVAVIGIGGALLATSDDRDGIGDTAVLDRPLDTSTDSTEPSPVPDASAPLVAPMAPPAAPSSPNASVAPPTTVAVPTTVADAPVISSTTTAAPTTTAVPMTTAPATAAPTVLAVQMSSTKLDFGTNGSTVGVTLRNPNPFAVTYSSTVTSGRFASTPSSGTLAAGQQISIVVRFDRSGALTDTANFPTGSFTHTLTLTTTADGGPSNPTRSATLYGTIERAAATTTTAAPAITIAVGKVAGTAVQCSSLGLRAVVTTNGQIAPKKVIGEAQFVDANGKPIRTASGLTMALGTDGYWRTSTAIPVGTAKVLLKVTAETTTGQRAQGFGTLSTAC